MRQKWKYEQLRNEYPPVISKDQFYCICHINKKTAAYILDSGLVANTNSGKKTRKYKILLEDVIAFLYDRDANPQKYKAPFGWYSNKQKAKNKKRANPARRNPASFREYLVTKLADEPDVLTICQIQNVTGYSKRSVTGWCKTGQIRAFYVGGRYVIPKEYLFDFMCSERFFGIALQSATHKALIEDYSRKRKH